MQCEEVREQFADYVIARVEAPAPLEIVEHLSSCAACRAELDELKSLWMQLENAPATEPTAELQARFDVMLAAYEEGLRRPVHNWRRPVLEFAAAAALLVIGIGVGYRMHTPPARNPELAELQSELHQTRQMVALSLMQEQSATDRLKGVGWSYRLQEPGADVLQALLDTLMHDSNVNVRLATVDALRQFGNQPVVRRGIVDAMTRQEAPMVQIALIDLAVDLKEKESVGSLQQLTQDHNIDPAVRDRAEKGLEQLR
ncbi:MAG TPA: HEAT repeat domain-containing protein [Terriglobia bacterium]|jgi:hypothetical protein